MLDEMIFSFSRLTTLARCPFAFYLQYIKKVDQSQNAFAEYGTFCHELLERYFTDKLMIFELVSEYEDKFTQTVIHDFPPNKYVDLAQTYFEGGLEYFTKFDGLPQYKIIEAERKVEFKIGKYPFVGFIDLIAEDKEGKIHIIDHKSKDLKKPQKKKWEDVETRRQTEFYEYLRQLYIYCIPLIEQENTIPAFLNFNCFRKNKWIQVPFDMEDYLESKQWALDAINKIYADTTMTDKYSNDWFCNILCGVKEFCPNSNRYLGI